MAVSERNCVNAATTCLLLFGQFGQVERRPDTKSVAEAPAIPGLPDGTVLVLWFCGSETEVFSNRGAEHNE